MSVIGPVINQGSAGHVLSLVRSGLANTRPELARLTGISRSAVAMRVDTLAEAGLVVEDGSAESTGGRRATYLRFAHDSGIALVADLDVTVARLAVTDLAGGVMSASTLEHSMGVGPNEYLTWMVDQLRDLMAAAGHGPTEVRGVGIGLPGPVEHATGRPITPPSMPGWDGFSVAEPLQDTFRVPVVVDNDVNLMAWGEYTSLWRHEASNFLFIKVAEAGIGCGIVTAGRIHHGAQGSAGAIGHIRVSGYEDVVCRCGNVGCLGAAVGGEALAKRLRERGHDVGNGQDVATLALTGDLDAVQEVRACGRALGEVTAGIVNFFNPEVIVVGGGVALAHEQLIAGLREVVYQRCLPLATRDLRLVPSHLGSGAGIAGASAMTLDRVLSPGAIDELLTTTAVESVS
jgi:predicted NBD/HSP70 family sugar kinase